MTSPIEALKREGKLRDQRVGFNQIEGLLKDAMKDVLEAKAVLNIGERATFILTYQAMLKTGRALLFLHGLRPADGAQHRTVIQACEHLLGKPFKSLAEQFESMRRKRNQLTYEYGAVLSHSEVKACLDDAEEWIKAVIKKVKEQNPQFELAF